MKKWLNRERVIGIICLVFGLAVWIASEKLPTSRLDPIGPKIFPKLIGISISVLSAIHILISSGPCEPLKIDKNWKELGLLLLEISAFLFLLKYIGFIFDSVLLLFVMVGHWDKRSWKEKWWKTLLFSVVCTAVLYVIFAVALKVMLPTLIL